MHSCTYLPRLWFTFMNFGSEVSGESMLKWPRHRWRATVDSCDAIH